MQESGFGNTEAEPKKLISEIVTAQGSIYRYLPDGRTQRYKTATEKLETPQDVIAFIPPWEIIQNQAAKLYPEIFGNVKDERQYEQTILPYAQLEGYTMRVIDEKGQELKTNYEVESVDRAFLSFIDRKNPKKNFTLPIATEPKLGYYTFDTRKFVDDNGETMRERHIGNKVVEIKTS